VLDDHDRSLIVDALDVRTQTREYRLVAAVTVRAMGGFGCDHS
jgi:hypothetical protein